MPSPLLIPAHTKEARAMTEAFIAVCDEVGVPDRTDGDDVRPLELERVQDWVARAMGFPGGWPELTAAVKHAHTPIYLDTAEDGLERFRVFADRLAAEMVFEVPSGIIDRAIQCAGLGYSPDVRRTLQKLSTPWGLIESSLELAEGITLVSTALHGGMAVSEARSLQMPEHLRLPDAYYERSGEWALVALAFPEIFSNEQALALAAVNVITVSSLPCLREADSLEERFMARTEPDYVPPRDDPMNREPTPEEGAVIEYLAACARNNRLPAAVPEGKAPTLQDWVAALGRALTVNGQWPMRAQPWVDHWVWRCQSGSGGETEAPSDTDD